MRIVGGQSSFVRGVYSLFAVALLATGITTASVTVAPAPASEAADLSQFQAGNIISDAMFFDANAMTVAEIQAFLNSKMPNCAGGYTCLKGYTETTHTVGGNPMCGTYIGAPNESAAMIIFRVGQLCGISSKAILVMLQKEQGLVLSTSPTAGRFESAMGAGCPDTAACDSNYYGFFNQVRYGSYLLKRYTQPTGTGPGTDWDSRYDLMKPVGQVSQIQYNPNTDCGTQSVFISNQATHSLYLYTPYTPNGAALAAGYSVGDGCSSYGNRNFFQFYSDWFGSTQVAAPAAIVNPAVTGTATVGSVLTAGTGTWTGLATGAYQSTGPNATRTYNGINVMAIQAALSSAGIATDIDGIYGPQTTANVRIYQSRYGLTADGIVGPMTWRNMSARTNAAPTFDYSWYSCAAATTVVTPNTPAGCTQIAGAAVSTYTVALANAGSFISARVNATNSAGVTSKWTISTAAIVGPPLSVTITGAAIVGSTLTAVPGSPNPALSYAWFACTAAVAATSATLPAGCAPIVGATQSTYVATTHDLGTFIAASITGSGGAPTPAAWSITTRAVVAAPTPTPTPTAAPSPTATPAPTATPTPTPTPSVPPVAANPNDPSITGTPAVGSTLTAGTGTWKGIPTGIYQGTGPNAARTYNGINVMAVQSALSSAGIPTTVDGFYGAQTIGNVRSYQTQNGLTVDGIVGPQTWGRLTAFVTAPAVFSYAWFRCPTAVAAVSLSIPAGCTSIAGATQLTYLPTAADAGLFLSTRVTATNSAGTITKWTISPAAVPR